MPRPHSGLAPEKKAPRERRWKEGEIVPREWLDWALRETSLSKAEVQAEADQFQDHWLASPGKRGVKKDWFATWRNWARRAVEFRARAQGNAKGKTLDDLDEWAERMARESDAREAARGRF